MNIAIDVFPPMLTRPCSFCLRLQGGSVFADFDTDDSGIVTLRRISFDGYGCYEAGKSVTRMSSSDSRLILEAIARDAAGSIQVEDVLQRYFRVNQAAISTDALAENDLI